MSGSTRVDVLGGGISGLASAYFLARKRDDVEIHVWERDARPGGLAGTFEIDGTSIEKFYHHIFRSDRALIALIAELGLADRLLWKPARTGAYYFNRPYRLSSPLDLLKFTPLPFVDRLRLGAMMLRARRVSDWRPLDEISAAHWIQEIAGSRVYRVVWEPLLSGKFGDDAENVSAAWLWSKLVDRGGSRGFDGSESLAYVRGGLGVVFETLRQRLEAMGHTVHLSTPVVALEGAESGIRKVVSASGSFATDLVISGLQLPDLVSVLPASASRYREDLSRIKFLGNVCLVLSLSRSLSEFYWTNVTDVEAPFVGIVEQTRWAEYPGLGDRHLVYVSAYCPQGDRRFSLGPHELFDLYLPHIRRMFPEFEAGVVENAWSWQTPWAQPVVHVGYRRIVPEIQSPVPNLLVCSMAQIYPNDRQVSNGVAAAERAAELASLRIAEGSGGLAAPR